MEDTPSFSSRSSNLRNASFRNSSISLRNSSDSALISCIVGLDFVGGTMYRRRFVVADRLLAVGVLCVNAVGGGEAAEMDMVDMKINVAVAADGKWLRSSMV